MPHHSGRASYRVQLRLAVTSGLFTPFFVQTRDCDGPKIEMRRHFGVHFQAEYASIHVSQLIFPMRSLLAYALFASATACLADSIYLIEGTVYKDCRIMYATDEEIVIEYPDADTPSIRREITLKKKDIYKHLKSTQEEIEAQQLEKRLRRAPMATKGSIAKTLAMYESFMKRYPDSSYSLRLKALLPAARATLQELEMKEQEAEAQGKLPATAQQPAIASPEEQERYQFDADANQLYKSMLEYARQRQEAKAMQMFSLLEKLQGAACFPKAYVSAVRLTGILENRWRKQLAEASNNRDTMERKIERMSGAKKVKASQFLRAQIGKQQQEYQQVLREAREKGYMWFNPPAGNLPALQNAWSYAQQERRRMSQPLPQDSPAGKASVLIRDFWDAIDDSEIVDAKEALKSLKGLGHNIISAKYTDPLGSKLLELQRKMAEQVAKERAASAKAAIQQATEDRKKSIEESRERARIERQKRLEAFEKDRQAEELAAEQKRQERAARNKAITPPSKPQPVEETAKPNPSPTAGESAAPAPAPKEPASATDEATQPASPGTPEEAPRPTVEEASPDQQQVPSDRQQTGTGEVPSAS